MPGRTPTRKQKIERRKTVRTATTPQEFAGVTIPQAEEFARIISSIPAESNIPAASSVPIGSALKGVFLDQPAVAAPAPLVAPTTLLPSASVNALPQLFTDANTEINLADITSAAPDAPTAVSPFTTLPRFVAGSPSAATGRKGASGKKQTPPTNQPLSFRQALQIMQAVPQLRAKAVPAKDRSGNMLIDAAIEQRLASRKAAGGDQNKLAASQNVFVNDLRNVGQFSELLAALQTLNLNK